MAILEQLNREDGITVLVVTHESEVADYASRRILIKDGTIQEDRLTSRQAAVLR
jgi:ABC-type lipoprotein export system ATPase subunit